MRDENNLRQQQHRHFVDESANKMASQSDSKTPTKQRNPWTSVEKEFLILCRELAIAEQLDNCVTSAGVTYFLF